MSCYKRQRSEGADVHLGEHTWLIWRALYLKAHKESDNGIGLWGLSPVRQAVTAAAAVVVIPTVPRWPLKRKNGSPLWVEIWSWAYSPLSFSFCVKRRPGICLHGYGVKCSAPWLGFCTVSPTPRPPPPPPPSLHFIPSDRISRSPVLEIH